MKINILNGYVRDFISHTKKLDVSMLYNFPEREQTKKWLAETASLLKKINKDDYEKFVGLCKRINPTILRIKRKDTAHEIDNFVRMKAEEYPIEDIDDNFDFNQVWKITNPIWILYVIIKTIYELVLKFPIHTILITVLTYLAFDYDKIIKNTIGAWNVFIHWIQ